MTMGHYAYAKYQISHGTCLVTVKLETTANGGAKIYLLFWVRTDMEQDITAQ